MDDGSTDQLDEMVNRLRIARAEVEDLARVFRARGHEKRPRDVGDVHEVPALGAVADDGHRAAVRLLGQEDAEDGAVRARRANPRAVHVEHADRHDRKAVDLRPVQRRQLADILAERVRVFRPDRRRLRGRHVRQTVARGRGRVDELPHARPAAALEHGDGAVHVGANVLDGPLDGRHDVADAAEVEHALDPVEHRRAGGHVAHVDLLDGEPWLPPVVREIVEMPGGQVVDDPDLEALGEQHVHHVAADEPGSARDERARCRHASPDA